MQLRVDHVAGAIFIAAGAAVFAASGDLPLGSMAMPGAGMMPKLALAFMVAFGLALVARAPASRRFAEIAWSDLPHALRVLAIAGAAAALYTVLGFLLTMALMLFVLLAAIERRPLFPAAAFSVGVTLAAYVLFEKLLNSPLPRGVLAF